MPVKKIVLPILNICYIGTSGRGFFFAFCLYSAIVFCILISWVYLLRYWIEIVIYTLSSTVLYLCIIIIMENSTAHIHLRGGDSPSVHRDCSTRQFKIQQQQHMQIYSRFFLGYLTIFYRNSYFAFRCEWRV